MTSARPGATTVCPGRAVRVLTSIPRSRTWESRTSAAGFPPPMSSSLTDSRDGRRPRGWLKCRHCRGEFSLDAPGTRHRNHCPWCLWSVHLDHTPGDRAAGCGGGMEPISVAAQSDGEWLLVHQCKTCHVVHVNRIAGDDSDGELLKLVVRPMRHSPFPL
jgi:hypothetical protein